MHNWSLPNLSKTLNAIRSQLNTTLDAQFKSLLVWMGVGVLNNNIRLTECHRIMFVFMKQKIVYDSDGAPYTKNERPIKIAGQFSKTLFL